MTQSNTIPVSVRRKGNINDDGTLEIGKVENVDIIFTDDNSRAVSKWIMEYHDKIYVPPKDQGYYFDFDLNSIMIESDRIKREDTIDELLKNDEDENIKSNDEY